MRGGDLGVDELGGGDFGVLAEKERWGFYRLKGKEGGKVAVGVGVGGYGRLGLSKQY